MLLLNGLNLGFGKLLSLENIVALTSVRRFSS